MVVTTSIIKVLYVILIVVAVVEAIAMVVTGVSGMISAIHYEAWGPFFFGALMVILSPVAFVVMVILFRMYMELIIVVFRVAEDIGELNRKTKG